MFDLSDIYIKEKAIEWESSRLSPSRVLSYWIYIVPQNVGDMELQKFNE